MRWRTSKRGDVRTRTFFAIAPFEFDHQVYWLEFVTVKEEYVDGYDSFWKVQDVVESKTLIKGN